MPKRLSFAFKRPQQIAAILLLLLLAQCLWIQSRQSLTERDYLFARCGREMWEKPSPLTGYFTSCGNIQDGTLAYRVAGLPLTIQRLLAGQSRESSTWEMRHELTGVLFLLNSGFLLVGLCLGAALWWVTRRLFGNEGGFVALALYCFSPAVIRSCIRPNNEILTAFGFFAAIYTAVGVGHATQGPRNQWGPRTLMLTLALGLTAASHVAAYLLAIPLIVALLAYLAEGRRASVIPILSIAIPGSLLLVFASYDFNPDAFSYYFRSGAGRVWLSTDALRAWLLSLPNAGATIAFAAALLFFLLARRSRYFGNVLPLLIGLALSLLITTEVRSQPMVWALPFLFVFIAGVFADVLEMGRRRIALGAVASVLALQAILSVSAALSPVLKRGMPEAEVAAACRYINGSF